MNLDKLNANHEKERNEYWKMRAKRLAQMQRDQNQIVRHCILLNSKTHDLLKSLLNEQRREWERMENDDLDMLLHMQELEREAYLEKERTQRQLMDLVNRGRQTEMEREP